MPLYIGSDKVDACYIGSDKIDKGMLGTDEFCGKAKPLRFDMLVTSSVPPTYTVIGGSLKTKDNGDGTYSVTSYDKITKLSARNWDDAKVVVNKALDLIHISNAWSGCDKLISFDASGLTSVIDIANTWSGCDKLISFDASALTSVTDARYAWENCTKLASFDASGLTSIINAFTTAEGAWSGCSKLYCLTNKPRNIRRGPRAC